MTHSSNPPTPAHGTPAHDPIEALLDATERLSANVETLSNNISVQALQTRRLRRIALAVLGVFILVGGVGYYAVNENHDSQVTNCQNANETREANRLLWNYVLTLAGSNANPANARNLTKIKDWVDVLYRERDCSDLSREYKQPDPPDLSDPKAG